MASSFPGTLNTTAVLFPVTTSPELDYSAVYSDHCHRIYSLAFWMTGNELVAEELSKNTFLRLFSRAGVPEAQHVDQAFLAEARESFAIGNLTLNAPSTIQPQSMRSNMKRVHLENAVLQLPATEKLIFLLHDVEAYNHERISHLLGISQEECRFGLHQARLRVRELVAKES